MNVYVAGEKIGVSIEKEDLEHEFGKHGKIVNVWVARKPPGFGFVEFEDARDGEDAIKEFHLKEFMGCELRVEESKGRGGKGGDRGGREMKPGDWNCFKCNAMNFARRRECFRCYAPGGEDGGRGGGRDYDRRDDRYDDRGRGGGRDYDRRDDRYDDRGRGGGRDYDRRDDRYDDRGRGGYDDRRERPRSRSPRRRSEDRRPARGSSRSRSPLR